ncbi:MAG: TetR/AcrR family transcriptional regulator [Myxococcota bacterium]
MTRHLPEKDRREQILAAARRCFISKGFHPTRMDDIARASELSKGGVYFHFKSKQEVFDSLVEDEFESSMGFLRSVVESEAPIADKLARIGQHYLQYFSSAPDAPRFFVVMGEMSLRDERLRRRLLEMQTAYVDMITSLIEQGIEEGLVEPVDARVAATILKAVVDGVEGMIALGLPVSAAEYLDTGVRLVLDGLRRR